MLKAPIPTDPGSVSLGSNGVRQAVGGTPVALTIKFQVTVAQNAIELPLAILGTQYRSAWGHGAKPAARRDTWRPWCSCSLSKLRLPHTSISKTLLVLCILLDGHITGLQAIACSDRKWVRYIIPNYTKSIHIIYILYYIYRMIYPFTVCSAIWESCRLAGGRDWRRLIDKKI